MLANRPELILAFAPLRSHIVLPFRKLDLCVRSERKRRQIAALMLWALQKGF